jgi:hypothetical protein
MSELTDSILEFARNLPLKFDFRGFYVPGRYGCTFGQLACHPKSPVSAMIAEQQREAEYKVNTLARILDVDKWALYHIFYSANTYPSDRFHPETGERLGKYSWEVTATEVADRLEEFFNGR